MTAAGGDSTKGLGRVNRINSKPAVKLGPLTINFTRLVVPRENQTEAAPIAYSGCGAGGIGFCAEVCIGLLGASGSKRSLKWDFRRSHSKAINCGTSLSDSTVQRLSDPV